MTFMMPTMMLIMNGVSVLIVWAGAHGMSDGQMQVGDMMAFIQYTMQIIMAFLMICYDIDHAAKGVRFLLTVWMRVLKSQTGHL